MSQRTEYDSARSCAKAGKSVVGWIDLIACEACSDTAGVGESISGNISYMAKVVVNLVRKSKGSIYRSTSAFFSDQFPDRGSQFVVSQYRSKLC